MTDDKEKPDAWVAIIGDAAPSLIGFSSSGLIRQLLIDLLFIKADYSQSEDYYAAYDDGLIRALKLGWRIRPVKLVYLDGE